MKLVLILACCFLAGCREEKLEEKNYPPQNATWQQYDFLGNPAFHLVCNDSSKVIADVFRYPMGDPWGVYGGDGRAYGEFIALENAKKAAEAVTQAYYNKSHLLRCP